MRLLFEKITVIVLITVLGFTDFVSQYLLNPFSLELPATVQQAQAATGDFVTFREAGGNESINPNKTPFDVTWDTTVDSNASISLQGNNSDIDLADGGKYLVTYNVWADEGSSGGSNRRSVNTYLTLAGNELAYGRGAGYMRDTENFWHTYSRGSAIINASAGDDLQVHIQRDDGQTTIGSDTAVGTNGVSIIKLPNGADYLRARLAATSSDISGNTSFTDVQWDTTDEVDSGSFDLTPTSGNITLKGADGDLFIVNVNVGLFVSGGGTVRQNYEMILTLDGTEIPGTRVSSYLRGTDDTWYGQSVYSGLIAKDSAGDQTLNVEIRRESSGGATTVIMGNQTSITAMAVPDTAQVIRLTDNSGSQTTSNTPTALTFDTQEEVDSSAFSHSLVSNTDRIEIDEAGDYLFFATAYATTTTSGNNRQPFRIDWLKTGATQNFGAFGAYVRANSSFSGGSSGAILLSGLGTSDYVSMTHTDETNNAPVDATFSNGRVAVQGIALNDNFYGLDTIVSASGTQVTSVDIPTTNFYTGGKFVIKENSGSRNVTSIAITESGSIHGADAIDNIKLFYEYSTTSPYDCSEDSYDGDEEQYGTTDLNGFSGANGSASFSETVPITPTDTLCVYTVLDITASSSDGDVLEISIDNPAIEVGTNSGTIGPGTPQAITGSTTARNAELTQIHYNWRNDNGSETTATSIEGSEDTPAVGFANGTTRRLRVAVSAQGSTSSAPTQYRLEYGQKTSTCDAVTGWTDVSTGGGGDWDVVTTANLTDGNDTTNVALEANGGVTDANNNFLSPNGGQKDTSSQTSNITLTKDDFVELEYAIEPTVSAPQGNTYCFRVTDAGTPIRNYDVYPEGTISADIDVSASSSHVATLNANSNNNYLGGSFVIERSGGVRTVTSITVTEVGSIDAANDLNDIRLYYDLDTSAPHDCTGESYDGGETQFGATSTAFSASNGSSTFSGTPETVNNTRSMCVYVVLDVGSGAANGETIEVQIADPSVDVVVTGSSVGPSTSVSPTGSTTISGPVLTQTHYHWRNDDGSETGATSASGGATSTAVIDVDKEVPIRLRIQVSNEGSVTSAATNYRLEYGTKTGTCEAVSSWINVGDVGGAWDMALSPNISDGNTTDIPTADGGMSNENSNFVGTGALRETTSVSGAITLSSIEFTELEYSIEATTDSGYDTTYCFRVTDSGTQIPVNTYAEATTRPKQDFFIQRGTLQIDTMATTVSAGTHYIAPAATTTAFVRITSTQLTGAGDATAGGTQAPNVVTAYISDQSDITTDFTITRPSGTSDTRVDWEIIEYIGIPGGDNEITVLDVDTIEYSGSSLTATGTAVTPSNDNDVIVFITGQYNAATNADFYYNSLSTSDWSDATNEPVFTREEDEGSVARLSYAVVEFNGANWAVHRVEHNYSTAGGAEFEPISPAVGSRDRAFVIHAQRRAPALNLTPAPPDLGLDELGHQVWLSSVSGVSFQLRSGATSPELTYSVAWVVENVQIGTGAMAVYRSNNTINSGGTEPETNSISIGATVRMSNASLFVTNDSSGSGTAFPRTMLGATIASTTHYELWNSDTGQNQDYRAAVIEWPVAETSLRQNYYRFYVDNDQIDPTDPWPVGAANVGENAAITAGDDPLGEGERVRIRMTMTVNNATLPENVSSFKLQYGVQDGTCSAVTVWNDVGAPGSGTIWRGYNGTQVDGTALATSTPASGTLNISIADVAGTYEEQNNSAVNPYPVDIGEDVEYDWVVEHNGAAQRTDYCFRMIYSDDTTLAGYINYPTIRTTGYTPIITDWQWFDDATSTTPANAMAAENVAPIDIVNGNEIKLRVIAEEIENAVGTNIKFSLQYSQYSDFSAGVKTLTSTSTCTATSIWCYADGAGVDNDIIQSPVLTNTDTCVAGVGVGCGTRNEAATTSSNLTHAAGAATEFEFTLINAAARANGVYYFRLYDVSNDEALVASSSYPSLVTEGAQLVFSIAGVDAEVEIGGSGGPITDATTSAAAINFGSLPIGSDYEAAQRLTINTNATEGYQVLQIASQQLTNSYGDEIPPITSTNSVPAGWGTACPGTATGCFGYHTTDGSLFGGSTRFAPLDSYAALDTSPQEIMYSSVPIVDVHDVVYRVHVTPLQPASDYETTLTYVAIPVF